MTDPDTYQQLALRTESLPPADIVALRDPNNLVGGALQAILLLSHEVDKLKKHIFYGKTPEEGVLLPASQDAPITLDTKTIRLLHAILGIQSELGEVIEAMSKGDVELSDELGDIAWYLSVGLDAAGCPLSKACQANIEKLRVRFPEKFTEEAAVVKDPCAEMAATRRVVEPGES